MPGTFSSLRIHVVFRTIESRPLLRDDLREPLERYLRGIVSTQGGQPLGLGGGEDHVHLLLGMKPTQSVAEMMKAIKGSSSRWANAASGSSATFGWAAGYSAFTVSGSRVAQTRRFLARQVELHRRLSFADEHRRLLARHGLSTEEWADTRHYLKVHVVFSTKLRMPLIIPALRAALYERIRRIVADENEILEAIGGIEDHVHLLLRIRPSTHPAGLVKSIKGATSHWVNRRPDRREHFGWQEGYSAFSVSASQSDRVKAYIETQEEHHKLQTTEEEFQVFRNAFSHG